MAFVPLLLREVAPELVAPADFLRGVALVHALPGAAPAQLAAFVGASTAGTLGAFLAALAVG